MLNKLTSVFGGQSSEGPKNKSGYKKVPTELDTQVDALKHKIGPHLSRTEKLKVKAGLRRPEHFEELRPEAQHEDAKVRPTQTKEVGPHLSRTEKLKVKAGLRRPEHFEELRPAHHSSESTKTAKLSKEMLSEKLGDYLEELNEFTEKDTQLKANKKLITDLDNQLSKLHKNPNSKEVQNIKERLRELKVINGVLQQEIHNVDPNKIEKKIQEINTKLKELE